MKAILALLKLMGQNIFVKVSPCFFLVNDPYQTNDFEVYMFTRIVSSCLCIAFTLSVLPSVSLAEKAKPKAKADQKPKVKVNFKAAKNQALLYYRKKMIPLAKQKFDVN